MTEEANETHKKIGERFVERVLALLGEPAMVAIATENRHLPDGVCATGDHCDADLVMKAAFEDVKERTFDEGANADCRDYNTSWDYARTVIDKRWPAQRASGEAPHTEGGDPRPRRA